MHSKLNQGTLLNERQKHFEMNPGPYFQSSIKKNSLKKIGKANAIRISLFVHGQNLTFHLGISLTIQFSRLDRPGG